MSLGILEKMLGFLFGRFALVDFEKAAVGLFLLFVELLELFSFLDTGDTFKSRLT